MSVHRCAFMDVCVYTKIYGCMYIELYANSKKIHIHTFIRVCIYIYEYVHTYINLNTGCLF